jgi:hypothetical protein
MWACAEEELCVWEERVWRGGLSVLTGLSRESCGLRRGTDQHELSGPASERGGAIFIFLL